MKMFLLILDVLIPSIYMIKKCYKSKNGFIIDHIIMFSGGFLFYWVCPIILGELEFTGLIRSWNMLYSTLENKQIENYLFHILIIYVVFIFSQELPSKKHDKGLSFKYNQKVYNMWMILVLIIDVILFIVAIRNRALFRGYLREMTRNNVIMAMMSAISLVIFSLYTMYSLKEKSNNFKKDFGNRYMIFFVLNSVILLSTGGRMYVVIPIAALFVIYTNYYKEIKVRKLFNLLVCIIAWMSIWGLLRLGASVNLFDAFSNVVAEPAYTAFSLFNYLSQYKVKLFNFPICLFTSLLNMVPSVIWPSKANYIVKYSDIGYSIYSPLGALNSYVSFMIEFGFIGSIIFIFILFRYIKRLQESKNELNVLIYSFLSADICFTFFRDPFSVSLIKNMLEYAVLIPIGIVCVNTIISQGNIYKHRRK